MTQRVLTAIIALIILVPLMIYGNWPFIVFSLIFACIGLYELLRMYYPEKGIVYQIISFPFLIALVYPSAEIEIAGWIFTRYDILLIFLVVLLGATVFTKNKFTFDQAGFVFFSTVYIGTAFYVLIEARMLGLDYLLFILFVIWATDSGAYFVGKGVGKRKLWPEISPNKTIGGAIGGIIAAILVGGLFQIVYPLNMNWASLLLIIIIISVVGQMGDLVASAIKRHYKVKDSGKLFPGHGGILDRLDSLMFVLIVLSIIQFI